MYSASWGPNRLCIGLFALVQLVRSRPSKTDQTAQFWMSTSWKLALDMRSEKTFTERTAVWIKDFDAFSECMSREPTQTSKRQPQQPAITKVGQKGYGKANTKSGKAARPSPHGKTTRPWSSPVPLRQDKSSQSLRVFCQGRGQEQLEPECLGSDWKTPPTKRESTGSPEWWCR